LPSFWPIDLPTDPSENPQTNNDTTGDPQENVPTPSTKEMKSTTIKTTSKLENTVLFCTNEQCEEFVLISNCNLSLSHSYTGRKRVVWLSKVIKLSSLVKNK